MMEKRQIKDKYARFKQWQHEPVKYFNCEDVHYCNNCGLMFAGNFCPRCSQKADMGRISWKSVKHGIMDLWGLGTRSLLFSIYQLVLRPGYFISDYIGGKRLISFPPVKMLFIISVIYALVVYWFFPNILGISLYDADPDTRRILSNYYKWAVQNPSWAMLGMSILAIIPTWIMFRYSPRNTRHNLPEGFFIQVFLAVLEVTMTFFWILLGLIHPNIYNVGITLTMMFYYIVSYMQLFGYGFWGTFWREAFIMFAVLFIQFAFILAIFSFNMSYLDRYQLTVEQKDIIRFALVALLIIAAAITMAVGHVINLLATREARKQLSYQRPPQEVDTSTDESTSSSR